MEILSTINSPADLKQLDRKQLKQLCQELREYIIEVTSKTGGHLASSLGVVELTVALHYVFDSPTDKFVWDVGHQGYPHKILTGRRDQFKTNRTFKGISGFIKYGESPHDHVTVGHSSTSISAALGLAAARDLKKENYHVVSIIGDGALTGGMAFEALNNAGSLKKNMLVILNDNNMSISRNVGAISEYLTKMMTQPFYVRLKNKIWDTAGNWQELGHYIRRAGSLIDDGLKAITPGLLFEELGFDYFGPIDGHNLDLLIDILTRIKNIRGPLFLHVMTQKGKGFSPAERDATTFHGVSQFDIEDGAFLKKSSGASYTSIFSKAITRLAEKNDSIVAITAAMETGTGLDVFHKKFPDRFFDVGIAEQHAVTFAANLARSGLTPVVAIYSTFLQRAFDQIIHDVALDNLPVVFAIDRGGLVGEDGPTHHGVFDLSYLRMIPNLTLMAPANAQEFVDMLYTATKYATGPVAIRYPRASTRSTFDLSSMHKIPFGQAKISRQGNTVAIIAYGSMVETAEKTAALYEEKYHVSPTVVNLRFLKPLDEKVLKKVLKQHEVVVTLEENALMGGMGSAISEWVHQEFPLHIPMLHLGIRDTFIEQGSREQLLELTELVPEKIVQKINPFLNKFSGEKNQEKYENIHI
ncbi:MAG: 1-deoxy-D-xylulose-5-phosphate synthase [Calditrichia bacterium]